MALGGDGQDYIVTVCVSMQQLGMKVFRRFGGFKDHGAIQSGTLVFCPCLNAAEYNHQCLC